ncbi:phage terminase large subunit [Psychrobacter aquaticus]|uniref:Phage terminase, large subunit n=1 Tax=Psychrobacter aquaticus CMS 56 TaxID=1354303 RepID=U4T485_9GAMM|nr:phage terminase large subunit [Psychrobacter aquaticus]ERL56152.1 Phage terminase, large subunit [Psychrobacter aquaticus CMS 56]
MTDSKIKAFASSAANSGAKLFNTLKSAHDTKRIVEWEELPQSVRDIPEAFNPMADGLLMSHQSDTIALSHEYDILVVEKGRRTGITFGMALDKSLVAASQRHAGGDNVYYVGDTKEKGLEFVGYCAKFLRTIAVAQGQGVSGIEEFLFEDQDEHGKTKYITSWRIRLASGFQIVALSSRPENIRGLQGHVVIDEAAFHRNVQAVLDAATALLIWGSRIVIISTHNGTTNAFNQLIKEVNSGVYEDTAVVYKVTFDDAVANGLYERVCLIKGELPTSEGKEKWYKKIRRGYGSRKTQMREELDAIARDGNSTSLPTVWIESASVQGRPVLRLILPENFVEKSIAEREDHVNAWITVHIEPLLAALDPRIPWYFGQDYARHRDFSIINPLGIEQNLQRTVPFVIEMQKVPAKQQLQILFAVINGLPNFVGGAMDATGTGETVAELTADEFGHSRIMQVKITQSWYGEYMPKMTGLFEDGMITMPADSNLTQDLRQIEEVNGIPMISPLRRKDLKDPDVVRHGDFAPSLCLSNCAYLNMKNGKLTVNSRPAVQDKNIQQGIGIRQRFNSIIRGY